MDNYGVKAWVRHFEEGEMTLTAVQEWGQLVASDLNTKFTVEFRYPINFIYIGDLTGEELLSWDHHFLDEDMEKMGNALFRIAIADGSILEDEETLTDMYHDIEKARRIFG